MDSDFGVTEESYTSLTCTYSELGNGGNGIEDYAGPYTDTELDENSEYSDASGDFSTGRTEITGLCTIPTVFPPAILDQYYVIQSTSQI